MIVVPSGTGIRISVGLDFPAAFTALRYNFADSLESWKVQLFHIVEQIGPFLPDTT